MALENIQRHDLDRKLHFHTRLIDEIQLTQEQIVNVWVKNDLQLPTLRLLKLDP
jgi:hypothetical protein